MQSTPLNKAGGVPIHKTFLTAAEEAELGRQAAFAMDADVRRRTDDPFTRAGRFTEKERAEIAAGEARLVAIRAAFDAATATLRAAQDNLSASEANVGRFGNAEDANAATVLAAARRLVTDAERDRDRAWDDLNRATSEQAELEAAIGARVRLRQRSVQAEANAVGRRQLAAEQAADARRARDAERSRQERIAALLGVRK